ncbi:MAG: hypothetical protein Q4B71_00300 [Cardiobacteriaceae bacterium]|nr:hypothetical protein [Cardiobacteriaceae bacterium]
MSNPKTAQCQLDAAKSYQAKALETFKMLISQHDQDVFDALQSIKAHHQGNRSGAVKAAILHYAQSLESQ